ncbi:MAG TPA: DUF1616 domain-containing protein [Candidatus Moranbacteria bacterium]|nr:DUF1616 domain-containing protein [Candidatus Moranbacteria bacterium]
MLNSIQNQILFFLSLVFLTFLPGWCLLLAVFKKSNALSLMEKFIASFGLSIISVDFIFFAYSGLDIAITRTSIILGVLAFSAVCLSIYYFICHSREGGNPDWIPDPMPTGRQEAGDDNFLFNFSKNQTILIFLLLFLTIFIKTAYLSTAIAPTATDLGHHLYWAKTIAETHNLTNYEGMPDFIIGEHTIIASINILTGLSFFTGWPVILLFLINILSILIVFILTLRIFKNKTIAILTLLFLGVLFAISSPQTKYVSGGVMGNIFGNFLMPLAFYFYYRSFEFLNSKSQYPLLLSQGEGGSISQSERETDEGMAENYSKSFLSLAVFSTFGLFYTHHLTSFIFLFIFALTIPLFLIINYKEIETVLKKSAKIVFSPSVLGIFILGLIFFFFVFTPTYVNPQAVDTAVGTATKSTRVGLTLANLEQTVGEPRIALGFLGFLVLILSFKRKNLGFSLLVSWTFMLIIMSSFPNLLLIDLPSSRIGNYLSYPLAILSAYAFYSFFRPDSCPTLTGKILSQNPKKLMAKKLLMGTFVLTLAFIFTTGLLDSVQAFKKQEGFKELNQTYNASSYLSKNTTEKDIILKDHNYITGDAWMKLFFMRGYKYPQSRGFFSRYEEQGSRSSDLCTLVMISNPNSDEAQKCFSETKTDFLVVNPKYDSPQFQRLVGFDQIYMSDDIAVYYRK